MAALIPSLCLSVCFFVSLSLASKGKRKFLHVMTFADEVWEDPQRPAHQDRSGAQGQPHAGQNSGGPLHVDSREPIVFLHTRSSCIPLYSFPLLCHLILISILFCLIYYFFLFFLSSLSFSLFLSLSHLFLFLCLCLCLFLSFFLSLHFFLSHADHTNSNSSAWLLQSWSVGATCSTGTDERVTVITLAAMLAVSAALSVSMALLALFMHLTGISLGMIMFSCFLLAMWPPLLSPFHIVPAITNRKSDSQPAQPDRILSPKSVSFLFGSFSLTRSVNDIVEIIYFLSSLSFSQTEFLPCSKVLCVCAHNASLARRLAHWRNASSGTISLVLFISVCLFSRDHYSFIQNTLPHSQSPPKQSSTAQMASTQPMPLPLQRRPFPHPLPPNHQLLANQRRAKPPQIFPSLTLPTHPWRRRGRWLRLQVH